MEETEDSTTKTETDQTTTEEEAETTEASEVKTEIEIEEIEIIIYRKPIGFKKDKSFEIFLVLIFSL